MSLIRHSPDSDGVSMPDTPYSYRAMAADLGHVLINWACAEQSLDMCVTIVFQKFPEAQKWAGSLPRPLNKKTAFMRRALHNIPAFKDFSELGISVMDQVDKLATDRNDMIHGALASIKAVNGQWRFLKFDYGSQIHTARPLAYSQVDLQEAGKEMLALAGDANRLYGQLRKFLLLPPQ